MIRVESDAGGDWDGRIDWSALADEAVRAAVAAGGHAALLEEGASYEVSVRFAGDAEVRALNAAWRGKDEATNVLSFPMAEPAALAAGDRGHGELLIGDIILAHGICLREARARGVEMRAHAAHLIVHGALHLLGYDHETSEEDADVMEEIERRALAAIGVADPYVAEVQS